MITEIHISRFRGFRETTIGGFRRVNLIGGLNNSGKTALLEAILLVHSKGDFNTLEALGEERTSVYDFNFFYGRVADKPISYTIAYNNNLKYEANINKKKEYIENYSQLKETFSKLSNIAVAPARRKVAIKEMVGLYNSLNVKEKNIIIKEFINCIEKDIAIEYNSIDELFNKSNGEKYHVTFWGDAIYRVIEIALRFTQARGGILLIDEVENGIHYTKQPEIWKLIHIWAKQFDVQVFATTHSLEMSRAFAQATLKADDPDQGVFIELYRNPRTEEVDYHTLDAENLLYAIENGHTFRGEKMSDKP